MKYEAMAVKLNATLPLYLLQTRAGVRCHQGRSSFLTVADLGVVRRPRTRCKTLVHWLGSRFQKTVGVMNCPKRPQTTESHGVAVQVCVKSSAA